MPFKFLKKRQYNVTSRSFFVIPVHHLLDTSTTVDCTISSESKGQECLDNVCQRLLIQQPEFFGLRYVKGKEKDKDEELRWVDLERSLSRQLEKYAAGTKLYLRVRHYVTSGVRHLTDEVTRYYYFLQLKSDIYEGKITCDIRTAILLALYCRQAEYDSYQNDKQTKEYLKKSLVLPKNLQGLANDDDILEGLIMEVLQQNVGIQHLTQSQAEEMYIQCCQQLDGYGEERFQAKDTLHNDLLLGLSINGMIVNAENGRQYFPWKDFHTVTIDKKTIKIEQNKADGSIVGSFNFSEADMARYFWKLCITHHKFFKRYIDEDSPSVGDTESGNGISIAPTQTMGTSVEAINAASAFGYDFSDSREDLLLEQQQRAIYKSSLSGGPSGILPTAAAAPEYMQSQNFQQQQMANSSALMSSNISLATSHQSGNGGINLGGGGSGGNGSSVLTAAPHMSSTSSWLNKDYTNEYGVSSQQLSGSMLDTRLQQSSSCLDLSNNNLHHSSSMLSHSNSHNNNNLVSVDAHERERLKAMLPTYRPAPDYETAVQLKYRSPSSELHNTHAYSGAGNTALHTNNKFTGAALAYYAGSQPDVHQATTGPYGESLLLNQLAQHRYPDVAQPAAALHHHYNAAGMSTAAHNSVIGASAVGNNVGGVYIDMAQHLQMLRSRPPPPYPVNRLSSSSTPDLAVASHRPLLGYHRTYVTGSSPDLVSNRNFLNSQYHYHPYAGSGVGVSGNAAGAGGGSVTVARNSSITSGQQVNAASAAGSAQLFHQYPYMSHMGHSQQYLPHGTFENLNMIEEQPSIVSQLRQSAISQAAASQAASSQSYEQQQSSVHSPPIYSPNNNNIQHTPASGSHLNTPAPLQRSVLNGSVEPIYENVPFSQNNNNNSPTVTTPPALPTAAAPAIVQPTPPQRNIEQRSSGASLNAHEAMRNRTASIQSAPGAAVAAQQPPVPAARHHHHQQLHQQQQQHENERNFLKQTTNRGSSSEMQFLEPTPPQRRGMRAASAAPAIGASQHSTITTVMQQQTPPPRQHHNKMNSTTPKASSNAKSTIDISVITSSPTATTHAGGSMTTSRSHHHLLTTSHDDSLQQQFGAMNLSASSASASSSLYNSTFDTTTNSTVNSSNSSTTKDTKRRRRWNVFGGRSKTPDKQKSATLGREKASPSSMASKWLKPRSVQDDLNLPHQRWSTGTAANARRSQPLSAQYSKDKLCEILNDKYNDPQLFIEFESISKRRDCATFECALAEENACKNSDPHFLPYDDNRVRLTPTMDNRHGYVNASHISATVGTKQRFYIVAQSPHDELTTRIFWQCVWEADVYFVVQLSDDLNYIPPSTHQCLEFGQFQVYQEFSQSTDRCTTSKLRIYHMQSRRYRSVWHLSYTNWAEQNCPRDVNHFLDFLEELNSVRMASINEVPPGHNTNPPVLLHCHEGGGRSGVTLTADLLLYTLDHNEDLDIPRVIGQLRHQRDRIIPSLAQYKFIYSLLYTYLNRTRLI